MMIGIAEIIGKGLDKTHFIVYTSLVRSFESVDREVNKYGATT